MKSKYSSKVESLNTQYNLGIPAAKLQKVVARLEVIKADCQDDQDWLSTISGVMFAMDKNPLTAETSNQARSINKICPLCNREGEKITLMGGREAFYCKAHRNVQPVIVEK